MRAVRRKRLGGRRGRREKNAEEVARLAGKERHRERIMGETRVGEKHGGFTAPLARSEFIARVISIHKR